MKIIITILLTTNLLLTTKLYSQPKQLNTFKNISALELKKISESDPSAVIIDVRTKKDYKKGHIENSISAIDIKTLDKIIGTLDFEQPLLIYCTEGLRSIEACIYLQDKGFLTVYNLETGLLSWKEAGFKLTKK
jgi:rhodanese-related sulfurtransferase